MDKTSAIKLFFCTGAKKWVALIAHVVAGNEPQSSVLNGGPTSWSVIQKDRSKDSSENRQER